MCLLLGGYYPVLIVIVFVKIGANHDQPLFGRCGCVCLYLYYMPASKCVCVLGKINLLVFVDCVIWLLLGWCFWNADSYP